VLSVRRLPDGEIGEENLKAEAAMLKKSHIRSDRRWMRYIITTGVTKPKTAKAGLQSRYKKIA